MALVVQFKRFFLLKIRSLGMCSFVINIVVGAFRCFAANLCWTSTLFYATLFFQLSPLFSSLQINSFLYNRVNNFRSNLLVLPFVCSPKVQRAEELITLHFFYYSVTVLSWMDFPLTLLKSRNLHKQQGIHRLYSND